MVSKQGTFGAPHALEEDKKDPTLGARSLPRTPEVSWKSDEEESISVLDVVEEEATPADKPRPEDNVFEQDLEIDALGAGPNLHVELAARVFNGIKSCATVVSTPLSILPEGVNRTLLASRIKTKLPPAPLLKGNTCQGTLIGTHQLRQHRGGKKHLAREARYQRENHDYYCGPYERFFPSAHDLDAHLIGTSHLRRGLFLREREFTRGN